MSKRRDRSDLEPGWVRARRVLHEVMEIHHAGATIDVGDVKRLGHGLSRDAFIADVEVLGTGDVRTIEAVVLLPREDSDPELARRMRQEARLLDALRSRTLPFRLPRVFGLHPDGPHVAMVTSFEYGLPLREGGDVCRMIGKIAAATHAIGLDDLPWLESRHATRLDHVRANLRELEDVDSPEVSAARAWIEAHLPPASPSVLLHGDLLGQNILRDIDNGPPAVIDWERAEVGDPAYDIAVVTRGVRSPLKMNDGMRRILEAYHHVSGIEIDPAHVHVHELLLFIRWYGGSLKGEAIHPPATYAQLLRSLLRRVEQSTTRAT